MLIEATDEDGLTTAEKIVLHRTVTHNRRIAVEQALIEDLAVERQSLVFRDVQTALGLSNTRLYTRLRELLDQNRLSTNGDHVYNPTDLAFKNAEIRRMVPI